MLDMANYNAENERRFFYHMPVNQGEDGCWIWVGPVFTRTKSSGDQYFQPKMYIRNLDGKLEQKYAHQVAWQIVYGWNSLLKGDCLPRNPAKCSDDLCVSPYHHLITDAHGIKKERAAALGAKSRAEIEAARRRNKVPSIPSEEEFLRGK